MCERARVRKRWLMRVRTRLYHNEERLQHDLGQFQHHQMAPLRAVGNLIVLAIDATKVA